MRPVKTFATLVVLSIATVTTFAQDAFFKVGLGYAFAAPGQKLDQYGNILNGSVSGFAGTNVYHTKNASFTSGVHGMLGGGLMFSKTIGVELDADINIAPRNYTETMDGILSNSNGSYDYMAQRKANSTIILLPSLLLQSGGQKLNAYMRMGIALPFNTGITLQESYAYQSGTVNSYKWSITNYFSLGFSTAAGAKLKINDDVAVYAEASLLYLNISRKERNLEAASFNGVSYPVSQLTGGIKTYHYSKNGVSDPNGNEQAFAQPFSNLGLSAGICLSLHHSTKKKV